MSKSTGLHAGRLPVGGRNECLLGALRNVVEHLYRKWWRRRGRCRPRQNLLLRGAERNLLERAFVNQISALIGLGNAPRRAGRRAGAQPRASAPFCPAVWVVTPVGSSAYSPSSAGPLTSLGRRRDSNAQSHSKFATMIFVCFPHPQPPPSPRLYGAIVRRPEPDFYLASACGYGRGAIRHDPKSSGAFCAGFGGDPVRRVARPGCF